MVPETLPQVAASTHDKKLERSLNYKKDDMVTKRISLFRD
jgi:hypothetical protein